MTLKAIYEKLEDIPEQFRELYGERTNPETKETQFELTGVEGVKTQADVDRVTQALGHEKANHKKTKDTLEKWRDMDADQVMQDLEELDQLRTKIETLESEAPDEEKINRMVEAQIGARLKAERAPLERELSEVRTRSDELETEVVDLRREKTNRIISDAVREAAVKDKVIPEALDDVLMHAERIFEVSEDGRVVTRDNVGVAPGLDPNVWLSDIKDKRTHWWPPSQGAGANGSGQGGALGENPFTHANWDMTKQGALYRQDPDKAERMAKQAGTTIGGPRPAAPRG